MAVLLLGGLGALVALFPRPIASIFTSDPVVLDEFVKVRLPLAATGLWPGCDRAVTVL